MSDHEADRKAIIELIHRNRIAARHSPAGGY